MVSTPERGERGRFDSRDVSRNPAGKREVTVSTTKFGKCAMVKLRRTVMTMRKTLRSATVASHGKVVRLNGSGDLAGLSVFGSDLTSAGDVPTAFPFALSSATPS